MEEYAEEFGHGEFEGGGVASDNDKWPPTFIPTLSPSIIPSSTPTHWNKKWYGLNSVRVDIPPPNADVVPAKAPAMSTPPGVQKSVGATSFDPSYSPSTPPTLIPSYSPSIPPSIPPSQTPSILEHTDAPVPTLKRTADGDTMSTPILHLGILVANECQNSCVGCPMFICVLQPHCMYNVKRRCIDTSQPSSAPTRASLSFEPYEDIYYGSGHFEDEKMAGEEDMRLKLIPYVIIGACVLLILLGCCLAIHWWRTQCPCRICGRVVDLYKPPWERDIEQLNEMLEDGPGFNTSFVDGSSPSPRCYGSEGQEEEGTATATETGFDPLKLSLSEKEGNMGSSSNILLLGETTKSTPRPALIIGTASLGDENFVEIVPPSQRPVLPTSVDKTPGEPSPIASPADSPLAGPNNVDENGNVWRMEPVDASEPSEKLDENIRRLEVRYELLEKEVPVCESCSSTPELMLPPSDNQSPLYQRTSLLHEIDGSVASMSQMSDMSSSNSESDYSY